MESVILENNKEYLILNEIKNGSDKYIYLVTACLLVYIMKNMVIENLSQNYLSQVFTITLIVLIVLDLFFIYRLFYKNDNSRKTEISIGLCLILNCVLYLINFAVYKNTIYFGKYFVSMVFALGSLFVAIYYLKK